MTKKLLILLFLCATCALHATNYLTFTAEADNSSFGIINEESNNPTIQYSLDKGKKWRRFDSNMVVTLAKKGDMALLKGNNPDGFSHGISKYTSFTMTGSIAASGSVMSLIDNKGDSKVIPCRGCFSDLFAKCTSLVKAPELPATELSMDCYWAMFASCTNLSQAPELPADSMTSGCYYAMFSGCTSLTQAPKLPATKLAESCYTQMFSGCTSLTKALELPAKTLYYNCYAKMFNGCASLTQAPALSITSHGEELSCIRMFANCTSLTEVPDIYAEEIGSDSCEEMFIGCTSLVKAPSLYCTNISYRCYRRMFKGCTSLTHAPELPATELYANCYTEMFDSCISLKQAPDLPATEIAEDSYTRMFKNCINLCSIKVCFESWYSNRQTLLDCFDHSFTKGWLSNVAYSGTFICPEELPEEFEENRIPEGWKVEKVKK